MNKRKALLILVTISVLVTSLMFGGRKFAVAASLPINVQQNGSQNNPPVASPQTVTTVHDQRVNFTLTGTDPDGNALQFNITSNPANGTTSSFYSKPDLSRTEGSLGRTLPLLCLMSDQIRAGRHDQVINNAAIAEPLMITIGRPTGKFTGRTDPDGDALQFNVAIRPMAPGWLYSKHDLHLNEGFYGQDGTAAVFDG